MFENETDCLLNDKTILKSQQRFKSDCHNIYTEQINKIALNSNDDKRLQIFDKITTYSYGTNAFKLCESKMISKIQMVNFDDYANENKPPQELRSHDLKWLFISDHPHRILIIGGTVSGKTNTLLNLINYQPDIDKIYFYAKDLYEAKCQFLINNRESTAL